MIIAALIAFGLLLAAWLLAPGEIPGPAAVAPLREPEALPEAA